MATIDYLRDHQKMLELAVTSGLPKEISKAGDLPLSVFQELFESGYVTAVDVSDKEGLSYLDPRITLAGREYLDSLQYLANESSASGKARKLASRAFDWLLGIGAGLAIAYGSSFF